MKPKNTTFIARNKSIIRIVIIVVLILLIPLIAMQFTDEVKWDARDFAFAGTFLLSVGLIYELIARKVKDAKSRIILGIVLAVVALLIWVELAVGVFETSFGGH